MSCNRTTQIKAAGKIMAQHADLALNLVFTYRCFSTYLFHTKCKREGTIILLSSYTGLEAQSRSLTDAESRLRLNPSCIKPSSLDYPSQPLVTSARAQKWILTVLSVLCVFMLQSAPHVVHWTKKHKNLAPSARWYNSFTDRERTHRVSPPTQKKKPSTHIWFDTLAKLESITILDLYLEGSHVPPNRNKVKVCGSHEF